MQFCADEAVQILGGAGFIRGTRSERIYREAKVFRSAAARRDHEGPGGTAARMVRMSDGKMEADAAAGVRGARAVQQGDRPEGRVGRPRRAEAALRHAPRADRQSAPADPARRRDLGGARRRGRLRDHLAVAQEAGREPQDGDFPSIGTIDLHVDYLRPGAASTSSPPGAWCGSATASRSRTWSCSTTKAS